METEALSYISPAVVAGTQSFPSFDDCNLLCLILYLYEVLELPNEELDVASSVERRNLYAGSIVTESHSIARDRVPR